LNGAKLSPFFSKDFIHIPLAKTEEYLHKFVTPLVAKNLVDAEGFTIQTVPNLPLAVLKITESTRNNQLSIFETKLPDESPSLELLFELHFEYSEFHFRSGHSASTIRMELGEESLKFLRVERNIELENQIVSAFQNWKLPINGSVIKLEYRKAIDWINAHYEKIEQLGVELRIETKDSRNRKLFVGTCSISMEIVEGNDWFDVKGQAIFGNYSVPIILILRHIRQNMPEIRLANGEYALIPQVWFDEYQLLSEICIFEGDRLSVRKHHCVIANNLKASGNNTLTLKDKLSKFLQLETKELYDLPFQFNGELRNYQLAGYQWLRLLDELGFGGCLADDMGLGKTIQTLCLLQWMKEQNRGTSLLIVPTSLVYNWQIETQKFCPEMNVYLYTGKNRSVDDSSFRNADLVIATYSVLRRDIDNLRTFPFHYLILDEAQAIKNPQSALNQACLELKANRFLTLTGTPVENSLSDLWSQIHFANRNMLGNVNHFMQIAKQPDKIQYFRQVINPFVLRRLKSAVLPDLPEKSIFVQYCDMTSAQLDAYRHIRNSYREQLLVNSDVQKGGSTFQLLEGLLRMRQCANHPVLADRDYTEDSGKFEMVCHKLEEVIREGNKVLVFSSFVEHLKLYKNYLDTQQIAYCYLDGSTKDRQHEVETFQNSSDHQVFLLSLKAGGTGLNLTRAGYVFLLDPWWNPAAEAQAFDRAHRIGQKNKVFVYKFISRNSIEEKIIKLQEEKIELFHSIIDAEQDITKQFNREELLGLLV
jgi:superfamily II DNA or RNA helicase